MNKQKFDYKEYLKKYIDLYKSKHTKKETIEYIRKIINKDSSVELPSVLADVSLEDASNLKGDSETKRLRFFNIEDVPKNLMDADLIKAYKNYISK